MTVSGGLGRSFAIRRAWCRPGEPFVWVLVQSSLRYDVEGLDLAGTPLPGRGKRAGKAAKGAAAAAGGAMLDFGLTAVFGGGDDASGAGTSPRTTDFPDVTVFGGDPDCKAVRLLPPRRIAEEFGPANVNLNRFWMDWALTPHRLAAFVNAPTRGTAEKQTNPEKSGLLKMTKSWTEKAPETFGPQQPGEPMRIADLRCFLEVSRNEIAGIDLGSRTLGPGFEPSHPQCFRITLDDGSGFDFYKPQPDLDHMMDMTQGRS